MEEPGFVAGAAVAFVEADCWLGLGLGFGLIGGREGGGGGDGGGGD